MHNKVVKNTLYNLIGSFAYLFSQWLMSILVVRLSGSYEEAGIFGTALSVTNIFYMISSFSIRNYQVADINDRFSNDEYITFRIITCAISLLILPVYLIAMRYSLYILLAVICYMLIKTAEAFIDVIQGVYQKAWRLDIVCKSFVIRGIVNLAVFSLLEWKFKNLVVSLLFTATASLICAVLLDIRPCKLMFGIKIDFGNKRLLELMFCCLPLFIHGFLSASIYSTPRIIAQRICGEEQFGFYASVAVPTVIVQLAVSNVFSPCITLMTEQYIKRDRELFSTIAKIQGIIIVTALAAVAGFSVLGDWFLESMFGYEILDYTNLLIPAVIGSVLIATAAFVASIFTVNGRNTVMAVLEGITFIIDLILSIALIKRFNLQGINYALIISCIFFILVGYCIVMTNLRESYKLSNNKFFS